MMILDILLFGKKVFYMTPQIHGTWFGRADLNSSNPIMILFASLLEDFL